MLSFIDYLSLIIPSAAFAALCVYYWTRHRRPIVINTPAPINQHPNMTIVNRMLIIQKANEYRNGRDTVMCRYPADMFFDGFKETLSYFMTTTMISIQALAQYQEGRDDYRRLATLVSFYLQRPIPNELVLIDERTMQYYWGFELGREPVKVDLTDESQFHHKSIASEQMLIEIFRQSIAIISRIEDSVIKYGPLPFDFLLIETGIGSSHTSRSALRSLMTVYYAMADRVIPSDWVMLNEDTRYFIKLFNDQRERINAEIPVNEGQSTDGQSDAESKPSQLRVVK